MLLTTLLLALLLQNPQQPKPATVSGVVLRSGSADPIAGAAVELSRSGTPAGAGLTTLAGADGKFSFSGIPPGDYKLAATGPGYMRGEYGRRGPNSQGLVFALAENQEMRDARIALSATGAIAGRIFDRKGAPMPYAQVQALRFSYQGASRVLTPVRAASTNDLGEYRLYWLPPGQYAVMATEFRQAAVDRVLSSGGGSLELQFPAGAPIVPVNEEPMLPIFYPGSRDPGAAAMLTVRSGEENRGIDLTLTPISLRKIRGNVPNPPPVTQAAPGVAVPRLNVQLVPNNPTPGVTLRNPLSSGTVNLNRNIGTFEISGVLPGSYYVSADVTIGQNTTMYGTVPVEVAQTDIDNVSLSMSPGFEATAHFTVEDGEANAMAAELTRLGFVLYSKTPPRTVMGRPASPQPPGTLVLRSLMPGDYSAGVSWNGLSESYVKSIRLQGADVGTRIFRLDGPPAGPIEIVMSMKMGSITGTALSATQQPLSGVTVVAWGPAGRTAITDPRGNFTISKIPPGDYKLYAFEDVEMYAWQNPEFLRPHESRGKAVHVDADATANIQVTAIPAGQ